MLEETLVSSKISSYLILCTINVLEYLLEFYSLGLIDSDDFRKNVEVKIVFLSKSLNLIQCPEKQKNIKDVLEKCNEILCNYTPQ